MSIISHLATEENGKDDAEKKTARAELGNPEESRAKKKSQRSGRGKR
jgi:hypothetical protein